MVVHWTPALVPVSVHQTHITQMTAHVSFVFIMKEKSSCMVKLEVNYVQYVYTTVYLCLTMCPHFIMMTYLSIPCMILHNRRLFKRRTQITSVAVILHNTSTCYTSVDCSVVTQDSNQFCNNFYTPVMCSQFYNVPADCPIMCGACVGKQK